jgi:hypothetical protein
MVQAATGVGDFPETNETNNTIAFAFPYIRSMKSVIEPEVLALFEARFGKFDVDTARSVRWLWGAITGRTDDWSAQAVNIYFSSLPVLGGIPDLATLALSNDPIERAFAFVGLLASVGDVIAIVPELAPLAVGSFIVDAAAATFRSAYHTAISSVTRSVLGKLPYEELVPIAKDLVRTTGPALKGIAGEVHDPAEMLVRIAVVTKDHWGKFNFYVDRVGLSGLGKYGVSDGTILLGSVLLHNESLTDAGVEAFIHIGDDVARTALAESDEAVDGLARVADHLGEVPTRRVLNTADCLTAAVALNAPSMSGLAFSAAEVAHAAGAEPGCAALKYALELVKELDLDLTTWTDDALQGLTTIIDRHSKDIATTTIARFTKTGHSVPDAFALIKAHANIAWTEDQLEGLVRVVERLPEDATLMRNTLPLYRSVVTEFSEDVIVDTLNYIRRADPQAVDGILNRVDDIHDLFQWRAAGNQLTVLDDPRIRMSRMPDVSAGDYNPALKRRIELDWNNGASLDGQPARLAEAFATESAIDQLTQEGYQFVFKQTQNGANGVDAVLWHPTKERWLIIEGKGRYSDSELKLASFEDTQWGRQGSLEWITEEPNRYLTTIDDPVQHARVEQMVQDLLDGESYDLVIARGGIQGDNRDPLDYGKQLDQLITEIAPNDSDWTVRFLFVNQAGK